MRVFAISDIHVDYRQNAHWVAGLSDFDFQDDILILAGDVSDSVVRLATCFRQLSRKFRLVFFVPGNHDIWVQPGEPCNSLEKFHRVLDLARSHGLVTDARTIGKLHFLPLFTWYDYSFGQPGEFIRLAWMDFRRCIWPAMLDEPRKISDYFLAKNDRYLAEEKPPADAVIITFSHFLPRIDVMPPAIPPHRRDVYPVLGSDRTDQQVRALGANVHIYGHSHVNRCVEIAGVYYINNAFAYPNESRISRKRLVNVFEEIENAGGGG